jgi:hypothetical protein
LGVVWEEGCEREEVRVVFATGGKDWEGYQTVPGGVPRGLGLSL